MGSHLFTRSPNGPVRSARTPGKIPTLFSMEEGTLLASSDGNPGGPALVDRHACTCWQDPNVSRSPGHPPSKSDSSQRQPIARTPKRDSASAAPDRSRVSLPALLNGSRDVPMSMTRSRQLVLCPRELVAIRRPLTCLACLPGNPTGNPRLRPLLLRSRALPCTLRCRWVAHDRHPSPFRDSGGDSCQE